VLDNLIAGAGRFIKDNGIYAAIFIIMALIFPVITIAAGMGYGIWWGIFHTIIFILFLTAVILGPMWTTRRVALVLWITGGLACLVFAIAIIDAWKPIAVLTGLVLSEMGLGVLTLLGSGTTLGYGIVLALSPIEDVKDAQRRGARVLNHFIGIAAWECFAAWYIISLGQYMSLYTTVFVICTAGVILYGGIAWEIGGAFGKKTIYYTAIIGFLSATTIAINRLLVEEEFINQHFDKQTWMKDIGKFLSEAITIQNHTLAWFLAIVIFLSLGFILAGISGKKEIQNIVQRVVFVIVGVSLLVWLVWFDGYSVAISGLTGLAKADLPKPEVWHGILRMLIIILIIPALAIRFQQGGFRGFTMRILWITPCVLLPWFLFEGFLWKWYPYLSSQLGGMIDTFLGSL